MFNFIIYQCHCFVVHLFECVFRFRLLACVNIFILYGYEGECLSDLYNQKTSHKRHTCDVSPQCECLSVASNYCYEQTTSHTHHRRMVYFLCVCVCVHSNCLTEIILFHNMNKREIFYVCEMEAIYL